MPVSLPFHSTQPGAPRVFHNNTACYVGECIKPEHWRPGDDGRYICEECARRNAAGGRNRSARSVA
jgi:hypothetical protein